MQRSAKVRTSTLLTTTVFCGLAALATTPVWAQANGSSGQPQAGSPQPAAVAPRPVGVIDIGFILQNHPTLKAKMDGIKSRMETADKEMQAKRESIMKQMEQLRERFNEGTPEYDKAEKQIAEQDTDFRLELVKRRKEFENAQAEILFEIHGQISQLLKYYCENTGVQVVLQVSRQPVDPKKPETIEMAMSQNVLYFDGKTDVTAWVLEALQKQLGSSNAGPARAAASPQGQVVR